MTEKHVLSGRKRDKLGNQTFEVLRPLSKLSHQSSKAFEFVDMFSIHKYCRNFKPGILLSRISEMRWLPSLSRLRPVRTHFSVTCPRLDENDGSRKSHFILQKPEITELFVVMLTLIKKIHTPSKPSASCALRNLKCSLNTAWWGSWNYKKTQLFRSYNEKFNSKIMYLAWMYKQGVMYHKKKTMINIDTFYVLA